MSESSYFKNTFKALTGNEPFPWQEELYSRLLRGKDRFPKQCSIPTGLGKTAIIPIWLIALAEKPDIVPRRLAYIVNRRTVVDQATREAERIRDNLENPELSGLAEQLRRLYAADEHSGDSPLAISTLRGQFADNGEWSTNPARPAVVVGTVDMIGSRLLFSGYGCGLGKRPMHAGFLGQDSLIIHDEAHLEPAFQELLVTIQKEQSEGRTPDYRPMRVLELTATSRGREELFELTEEEMNPPDVPPDPPTRPVHYVWRRLRAKKTVHLYENADPKKLADEIADLALRFKDAKRAVLVFLRKVDDVEKVVARLRKEKQKVQQLTGTLRGMERDRLAKEDPVFLRFRPKAEPENETVYLVCTSAGEVGVDISADHLACDLSTFESMAQRFGRVNRFGDRDDTEIHVVYPNGFNDGDETDQRRKKTLDLLQKLDGNGSPEALGKLDADARLAAFTPTPTILPTSDILFDAWALTTIRDKLPGRPPVEPYLHGIADWEPETHVAWREEVEVITNGLLDTYKPGNLLDDYPLKPHELLRDNAYRVFKHLHALAEKHGDKPVWIVANDDSVRISTLGKITEKNKKDDLNGVTVLLPPSVGGLRDGLLDSDAELAEDMDVSDRWYADDERTKKRRIRAWDNDPELEKRTKNMRLVCPPIDTKPDADEDESINTAGRRYWYWYDLPQATDSEDTKNAERPVRWQIHTNDVLRNVERFIEKLWFEDEIKKALILAARFHDFGKVRVVFQRILGNQGYNAAVLATAWAKSGSERRRFGLHEDYRHEFGSLLDVERTADFAQLDHDTKDLVRHLIAAHHGRARPHFPGKEAFDPESSEKRWSEISQEVPRRFARLQRKYGRWGLAYLESLLRAADWAASAKPSEFVEKEQDNET